MQQIPYRCRYGSNCFKSACRYAHWVPTYSTIPVEPPRAAAGMAILNPSKTAILMVRQMCNDLWSLPKGGVESHDLFTLNTAIREVKEETGFEMFADYIPLDVTAPSVFTFDSGNIHHIFHAVATSDELRAPPSPDEIKEVAWIPLEEVLTLKINAITRMFIKRQKTAPALW